MKILMYWKLLVFMNNTEVMENMRGTVKHIWWIEVCHSSNYEEYSLQGCSLGKKLKFWRNKSPPYSERNSKSSEKPPEAGSELTSFFPGLPFDPEMEVIGSSGMLGCLQTTQHYNPEDCMHSSELVKFACTLETHFTANHNFQDWCCHVVKTLLWTCWPPSPSK
jgi:hypothetical protein